MAIVSMNGKTIKISSGYKVGLGPLGDVIVLKKDGYKVQVTKDEEKNIVVKEKPKSINVILFDATNNKALLVYNYFFNTDYASFKETMTAVYNGYNVTGYTKSALTLPTEAVIKSGILHNEVNITVTFTLTKVIERTVTIQTNESYCDTPGTWKINTSTQTIKVANGSNIKLQDYAQPSRINYEFTSVLVDSSSSSLSETITITKDTKVVYNYKQKSREYLYIRISKQTDNSYTWTAKAENSSHYSHNGSGATVELTDLFNKYKRIELLNTGANGLSKWIGLNNNGYATGLGSFTPLDLNSTIASWGTNHQCKYSTSGTLKITAKNSNVELDFVVYYK